MHHGVPKKKLYQHAALMAGREFCYSIELVSVTPILRKLGVTDEGTSWVWIISPILGLTIGPWIGSWSDRCQSKLGRRRPFILALSILAMIGMTLLSFAVEIGELFDEMGYKNLIGLIVAISGSQLMDWGLDSTETPAKAYTLDCIQNLEDQDSALNIQTLFIGVGGGIGYLCAGVFGMDGNQKLYFVALVFFCVSLFLTMISFKERRYRPKKTLPKIPPIESNSDPTAVRDRAVSAVKFSDDTKFATKMKRVKAELTGGGKVTNVTHSEGFIHRSQYIRPITMARGFVMSTTRWTSGSVYHINDTNSMPGGLDKDDWSDPEFDLSEDESSSDESRTDGFMIIQQKLLNKATDEDDKLSCTTSTPCLAQDVVDYEREINNNERSVLEITPPPGGKKKKEKKKKPILVEQEVTFRNMMKSIYNMPVELATLCLGDLCNWVMIVTLIIYYTDVFGYVVYEGNVDAPENSTDYHNYQEGFAMGCYGLVLYSISMSICSASIERYDLFNKLGMKFMYVCVYTLIAISSFVMFLYPSEWVILSLTLVIGSGFAVLYTLPFQILSRYFRSKIYLRKSPPGTRRSYGLDCAILISQTYLGQLIMSLITGPIIAFYSSPSVIFLICSVCAVLGAFVSGFLVRYEVAESKK